MQMHTACAFHCAFAVDSALCHCKNQFNSFAFEKNVTRSLQPINMHKWLAERQN